MGDHYIPQFYLRSFAVDGRLWVVDREQRRVYRAALRKVAQENDMYPRDLESFYSNEIEGPAASALRAVTESRKIGSAEKSLLSRYLVHQLKRVPAGRSRFRAVFPKVAIDVRDKIISQIEGHVAADDSLRTAGERRVREVTDLVKRWITDPPDHVWHGSIGEQHEGQLVEVVGSMNWWLVQTDVQAPLLSNDNPVFWFDALGLGNEQSEFSWPITSSLAILGDRRGERPSGVHRVPRQVALELNRRTVRSAFRFVFSPTEFSWLRQFALKDHPAGPSIR